MGFIIPFYIIFGTNLLTESLVQIAVFFAYFSVSRKRNIKRNETFERVVFGTNVIQGTWSRHQERNMVATRQGGVPPTLVGPSQLHRPTSFAYIYSYTLKPTGRATKHLFHRRNLLYP